MACHKMCKIYTNRKMIVVCALEIKSSYCLVLLTICTFSNQIKSKRIYLLIVVCLCHDINHLARRRVPSQNHNCVQLKCFFFHILCAYKMHLVFSGSPHRSTDCHSKFWQWFLCKSLCFGMFSLAWWVVRYKLYQFVRAFNKVRN